MDIKQLENNKIRVYIHNDDLKRYKLDLNCFLASKLEKLPLFIDILKIIYENHLLSIENKNFYFETYFFNNSEIIINIFISKNFSCNNFSFNEFCGNFILSKNKSLICEFDDFDFLLNFIKAINLNKINYSEDFFNNMYIYEFNNYYFFILNNIDLFSNIINYIIFQLSEFSDNISFSDMAISKVTEYGNIIFDSQNIDLLIK